MIIPTNRDRCRILERGIKSLGVTDEMTKLSEWEVPKICNNVLKSVQNAHGKWGVLVEGHFSAKRGGGGPGPPGHLCICPCYNNQWLVAVLWVQLVKSINLLTWLSTGIAGYWRRRPREHWRNTNEFWTSAKPSYEPAKTTLTSWRRGCPRSPEPPTRTR